MTQSRAASAVRSRQDPLRSRYLEAPSEARITDCARTRGGVDTDPFHGEVVAGPPEHGTAVRFGIHRAVGGDHDLPNPGDLLCAALGACLDSVIRMIADRLGVRVARLEVGVEADVDVRGTLLVDRAVPVGFQEMRCAIDLEVAEDTPPSLVEKLLAAAEHSCVNLQTLRAGVSVKAARVRAPEASAAAG